MANIYRVHRSSEEYFHYQVGRHHLTTATLLISKGAISNYNIYMNPDVKVYYIASQAVNLSALESDFRLNPPTKNTFVEIGPNEFFI